MTNQITSSPDSSPGVSLSTFHVWKTAIFNPTVVAYHSLINQPRINASSAYIWVFVATWIGNVISSVGGEVSADARIGGVLSLIFAVPGLIILTGITQGIAAALGGKGSYQQLVYLIAAGQAPLTLISSVLGLIPVLGSVLSVGSLMYGFILVLLAVKVVNNLSWGRAFISSLGGYLVFIALTACATVFLLALFGPATDSMLNNVTGTLEP